MATPRGTYKLYSQQRRTVHFIQQANTTGLLLLCWNWKNKGHHLRNSIPGFLCCSQRFTRKLFVNTSEAFPVDSEFLMMIQKGVYPYEYNDDFERLNEYQLPKKKHFYSRLNNSHITVKDYARVLFDFKEFHCKSIMDYHKLYLKAWCPSAGRYLAQFQKSVFHKL